MQGGEVGLASGAFALRCDRRRAAWKDGRSGMQTRQKRDLGVADAENWVVVYHDGAEVGSGLSVQ
jgi:hypothetical protein